MPPTVPEPEADLLTQEALGNRTVLATLAAAGVVPATAEQRLGATVADVDGGIVAWEAADLPTVTAG